MANPYHAGELAVQGRVGVRQMAARVGNIIDREIPAAAQAFLAEQKMLVISSVDEQGRVWASLLTGQPGFVTVLDDETLSIEVGKREALLAANLTANQQVGLLAIEPASRRRMRLNGWATLDGPFITVHSQQVYANCPKYIQAREIESVAATLTTQTVETGLELTAEQTRLIERADTFFIGSFHPEKGADASHRGGQPGFVRVAGPTQLAFPDYSGNMMFQTLGNLTVYPSVGLLFLDFETGATLQLTGQARVNWDEARAAEWIGAQRVVEFEIEEVIATTGTGPLQSRFLSYSKFNPQ